MRSSQLASFLGGGTEFVLTWLWIIALLPIVLFFPNTQEVMERGVAEGSSQPAKASARGGVLALRWAPNMAWALIVAVTACLGFLSLSSVSEFLYFQF